MVKQHKHFHLAIFIISTLFLAGAVAAITFNFETIKDFIVGLNYRPSSEMAKIRDSLNLTAKGARIFNAAMPELMERTEFNNLCRESESETAILGCYREDRVYIYNIVDEELKGIRELTSAHELLHAVYHRLSPEEKTKYTEILNQVYEENKATLGEEIDLYDDAQKQEELYVREGTEIKNLPEILENHYREIFENQDQIVDYYENYITVFRELERTLKNLMVRIEVLEAQISVKTKEYESGAETLNKDINEFNECAKTPNCFTSTWTFNTKRNDLIARQSALGQVYEEINSLITEYNNNVAKYNENIIHGQALNMTINSSTKIENL